MASSRIAIRLLEPFQLNWKGKKPLFFYISSALLLYCRVKIVGSLPANSIALQKERDINANRILMSLCLNVLAIDGITKHLFPLAFPRVGMDNEESLSASSKTRPLLKKWVRPSLSLTKVTASQAVSSPGGGEIENSRSFLQALETAEGFWENADALKTPSDLAGVFKQLENFFVVPVISPYFSMEDVHKGDMKRGNYKCGLCGQMKNKHRCPYGPWQKHCETQVDLTLTSWGRMYPSVLFLDLSNSSIAHKIPMFLHPCHDHFLHFFPSHVAVFPLLGQCFRVLCGIYTYLSLRL